MESIQFKLEAFEGPLDLLLHLVSKHKLNIYDIEISLLLEQYLAYIDAANVKDYEQAADFLEMAARLIYIKTCYLLPQPEEAETLKKELQGRMLEYSLCKLAAERLREDYAGGLIYVRAPVKLPVNKQYTREHDKQELLDAYLAISSKVKEYKPLRANMFSPIVSRRIVSVESKIEDILMRLYTVGHFEMSTLYDGMTDRSERIAAFLAVLELTKSGRICLNDDNTVIELRSEPREGDEPFDDILSSNAYTDSADGTEGSSSEEVSDAADTVYDMAGETTQTEIAAEKPETELTEPVEFMSEDASGETLGEDKADVADTVYDKAGETAQTDTTAEKPETELTEPVVFMSEDASGETLGEDKADVSDTVYDKAGETAQTEIAAEKPETELTEPVGFMSEDASGEDTGEDKAETKTDLTVETVREIFSEPGSKNRAQSEFSARLALSARTLMLSEPRVTEPEHEAIPAFAPIVRLYNDIEDETTIKTVPESISSDMAESNPAPADDAEPVIMYRARDNLFPRRYYWGCAPLIPGTRNYLLSNKLRI